MRDSLKRSSDGGEGEESTVGRAGETRRPPMVAVRFSELLMVCVMLDVGCSGFRSVALPV